MSDHDLIIHGTSATGAALSLAVSEGKISAIGAEVGGSAGSEIDYGKSMILPGWIDAHVHFNEPGRTDWEGLHSGSLALAAGGGTAFFDMPLNSSPPVTNLERFLEKRRIAEEKSHLDFALWGGLTPDSLDFMEEMAEGGAIGFKAFMCHSGLDEYQAATESPLRKGMEIAQKLGLPVAVHAEISHPVNVSGKDMAAWIASRPREFELTAIRLALGLAEETGCALHIVHVTCHEGIDLISVAKGRGVDVTVETCPHYLLLSDRDACEIGAPAKCAPPLRPGATIEEMWERLRSGAIDTIGSDHSPASPDLKTGDDMFAIWGGIAGIQHGLPLVLEKEADLAAQTRGNIVKRFKLEGKAPLSIGSNADFIVVKRQEHLISADELLTRHRISPYVGKSSALQIEATYLRGEKVTSATKGRFMRPEIF
ncbi:allantoinase AllB [Luteolibacter sp. AS25]|uniref:allantoinase AllB n=1 Tax=Luteolibacter sp. AS25 TaxID=3135776 RepID=UPI00398B6EBF